MMGPWRPKTSTKKGILWVFLPPSCGLVYLIDYGFEKDIQHHPRLHCGLVVRAGDCPLVSLSVLDVIRIVFFAIAIVFGSLAILAGLVVIGAALVVIISDSLFIAIYVLFALRDLLYVVFSSLSAVLDGFAIAFDRLGVFLRGFLDCPRRVPVIVMAVFFLKGYHIALRLVSLDFATYVSSQCAPIASAPSYTLPSPQVKQLIFKSFDPALNCSIMVIMQRKCGASLPRAWGVSNPGMASNIDIV
jgi:hypothetical protein